MLKTLPAHPPAMSPKTAFPLETLPATKTFQTKPSAVSNTDGDTAPDSLFEHFAWLYIFCREKLFRDDTGRMIRALWPAGEPTAGEKIIELGCGPGFYSCGLAERFPKISVVGVDRSPRQINRAREKVLALRFKNCRFESDNVLDLSYASNSFDVLIASRLFTVLPDRRRAVAEMHRVLRSGGRCFIAEPRYAFWASIPLYAMWLLAGITHFRNGYREPSKARVLSSSEMYRLFATQPWRNIKVWRDGRYQYALCEKS
jgi:ubiquinone/menaquinone biosynthesis C-methylase UbiE